MVREFAASGGLLRDLDRDLDKAPLQTRHDWQRRKRLVDLSVISLVLVFLLAASVSVTHHLAQTRVEQIDESGRALLVATRLAIMEIADRDRASARDRLAQPAFPPLPPEAMDRGRRFLLLDNAGMILSGSGYVGEVGRPARQLFADPAALARMRRDGALERLLLAGGSEANVVVREIPGTGYSLLAFETIAAELSDWRYHAWIIAGILLCFGAVTIAFTLAFVAQRGRAATAGSTARRLRSQFEIALDHGRCGLWDWSLDTDRMLWSASMHGILGEAAREETSVSAIIARLHPDDADLIDTIRAGIGSGQVEIDRLFRMRHAADGWMWLRMRAVLIADGTSEATRLIGMIMDITREREAEEEIRRADMRLRDAIESISEAFVLWDESNRLVLCNSKYQSFHGLPPELVRRGVGYDTLMTVARQPQLLNEIERGTEPGSGARCYEAQFGDGRWLLISERRTHDGGYVSVGTDITTRKTQEERLLRNERQLRMSIADLRASREALRKQASQLSELADRYLEQKAEAISAGRAKSEFLANMNHEIRTPLNHIIGFAEMIEKQIYGPCGSARYTEYAKDIRESGTSLLAMVSDILDMAQIEAGHLLLARAPVSIATLLERAADEVRGVAEEKCITIEIEPDAGDEGGQRAIHVDAHAVSQALSHLLRNGIRLSPRGGRVSLRARMNGDHVNIFVADSGCALSARALGTITDPFGHIDEMLQDGCKGSGLSVPIARALIELHGGTMRLRSAPHIGSLIMARLPVSPPAIQLGLF